MPQLSAEDESTRSFEKIRKCIEEGKSFKVEAGAGAGKTYSLIETLRYLIEDRGDCLHQLGQRIACITYTNIAKEEIETRIDQSEIVQCSTIHGFCWSLISRFQHYLREYLPDLKNWSGDSLKEVKPGSSKGISDQEIKYSLGNRSMDENEILIHHNDVLLLTRRLLSQRKFQNILRSRYPIILIDEYQDTDKGIIEDIMKYFLEQKNSPLFGFFGDHWQRIYDHGCGEIRHPRITPVDKYSNFRSAPVIVDCLNRIRPKLKQVPSHRDAEGQVLVFHTNTWTSERKKDWYHKGDLSDDDSHSALNLVREELHECGWDSSTENPQFKIFLLTHRSIGGNAGYKALYKIFSPNNRLLINKEHPHIKFFVDTFEPACEAFANRQYGEMFEIFHAHKYYPTSTEDKRLWFESMTRLMDLKKSDSVGGIIQHLGEHKFPGLPDSVKDLENGNTDNGILVEQLRKLHDVPYKEIISFTEYNNEYSPFRTQHGVKGAEFENILVVFGRDWNKYNCVEMLGNAESTHIANDKSAIEFEDNRNLFYVCCSRAKKRMALLFTQEISRDAMNTVKYWFGKDNVKPLSQYRS